MSADNAIYVQLRGDFWCVWEGSASIDNPKPGRDVVAFGQEGRALAHALGRQYDTEHGTIVLEPMDEEAKVHMLRCPYCHKTLDITVVCAVM